MCNNIERFAGTPGGHGYELAHRGIPGAATYKEDIIMKITVCIGSSCHIKGSRQVVQQLQQLIAANDLGDAVDLGGIFCTGNCQKGVCVTVDGQVHSVSPETVEAFFNEHVKGRV